jgi:hypothetical protein
MQYMSLRSGQVLYEQRAEIEYSYFPTNNATLSNVLIMPNGSVIEVATVGSEGGVGWHLSTPVPTSLHRVFAQVAGDCFAISTALLEAEVRQCPALQDLFNAYHAAFWYQVSQSVACNGLHKVEMRCCRWLLMTHDRVEGDDIALTHEFLGNMLGVRRSTVTEVLLELQERGIINNSRGKVRVLDRAALEATSCECYQMVRQEYQRLLY